MKIKPYEETHMEGHASIDNLPSDGKGNILRYHKGDLGIKIAEDGRIWVCLGGVSFLRFTPTNTYHTVGSKLNPPDPN